MAAAVLTDSPTPVLPQPVRATLNRTGGTASMGQPEQRCMHSAPCYLPGVQAPLTRLGAFPSSPFERYRQKPDR